MYKKYWITWFALLIVTLVMIFAGTAASGGVLLGILLAAMTFKAGMISGMFMHLKSEPKGLIFIVVLGIALVGLALFAGIAPDAIRVLRLSAPSEPG